MVTKYGEEGGGGACEVLPLRKGGGVAMIKGDTQSFEVVLTQELEVLAIVMGGGAQQVVPCLEGGGGAESFGPTIFPFCSHPPHN